MTSGRIARYRATAALLLAGAAAVALWAIDSGSAADDTGVLVVGLLAASAGVAFLFGGGPLGAIPGGLIPGVAVAVAELGRGESSAALIPLALAAAGALTGYAASRALRGTSGTGGPADGVRPRGPFVDRPS